MISTLWWDLQLKKLIVCHFRAESSQCLRLHALRIVFSTLNKVQFLKLISSFSEVNKKMLIHILWFCFFTRDVAGNT